MRILVSWLRDFVDVDATVQDLADVLTMRGFEVSAIEPAPAAVRSKDEDAVLDLEITTNRPDCLSVIGIAREVSTIYRTALRSPASKYQRRCYRRDSRRRTLGHNRSPRPVPPIRRDRCRCHDRSIARLARRSARSGWCSPHQQRCRRDQLRHARARPSNARV